LISPLYVSSKQNKGEDWTQDAWVIVTSQQKDKEGKYTGFLATLVVEIMRSLLFSSPFVEPHLVLLKEGKESEPSGLIPSLLCECMYIPSSLYLVLALFEN
jgi:hypothetical protein